MTWHLWIRDNWNALTTGAKLEAPQWLPAPAHSGFAAQPFASPEGQAADWTLSLNDRSRIHVHEYKDGRRVVHRDKHDPDQGLGDMIAHLVTETPLGVVAMLAGLFIISAKKG